MKYRSKHPSLPVEFSFGGTAYAVAPGETVELADRWHEFVVRRGLMLEVVTDAPPAPPVVVVAPKPVEPPAPPAPKPTKKPSKDGA